MSIREIEKLADLCLKKGVSAKVMFELLDQNSRPNGEISLKETIGINVLDHIIERVNCFCHLTPRQKELLQTARANLVEVSQEAKRLLAH